MSFNFRIVATDMVEDVSIGEARATLLLQISGERWNRKVDMAGEFTAGRREHGWEYKVDALTVGRTTGVVSRAALARVFEAFGRGLLLRFQSGSLGVEELVVSESQTSESLVFAPGIISRLDLDKVLKAIVTGSGTKDVDYQGYDAAWRLLLSTTDACRIGSPVVVTKSDFSFSIDVDRFPIRLRYTRERIEFGGGRSNREVLGATLPIFLG